MYMYTHTTDFVSRGHFVNFEKRKRKKKIWCHFMLQLFYIYHSNLESLSSYVIQFRIPRACTSFFSFQLIFTRDNKAQNWSSIALTITRRSGWLFLTRISSNTYVLVTIGKLGNIWLVKYSKETSFIFEIKKEHFIAYHISGKMQFKCKIKCSVPVDDQYI